MDAEVSKNLVSQVETGGFAYVRNLAAAESAVMSGQFNLAKVLRAAAHSQRVMAMNEARLLVGDLDQQSLLEAITREVDTGKIQGRFSHVPQSEDEKVQKELKQINRVREQLRDLLIRSSQSLEKNNDVSERDVAQTIWGCYGCGYLIESDLPDACPVCGSLGIEFEWFGPFYSKTAEHLGQRSPGEIVSILQSIPSQVETLTLGVDDQLLSKSPSEDEWSVNEIIAHIIEVEVLFRKRIQLILEQEGFPPIPGSVPPWRLHEGKGYEQWQISDLVGRLNEIRQETVQRLSGLDADQWMRAGSLQGNPISLLDLGTWLANHDLGHIAQIRRYVPESSS